TPPEASTPSAARVLVVYPTNVPGSKEAAEYYAEKRGVPKSNLLGVTNSVQTSHYYTGEYPKFYADLAGPIKGTLAKLGPTNIDVILLVGGIPNEVRNAAGMAVSVDNSLMMVSYLDPKTDNISTTGNPYFEPTPTFGTDLGHFDHRLHKFMG